jgi:hypothetical protein
MKSHQGKALTQRAHIGTQPDRNFICRAVQCSAGGLLIVRSAAGNSGNSGKVVVVVDFLTSLLVKPDRRRGWPMRILRN